MTDIHNFSQSQPYHESVTESSVFNPCSSPQALLNQFKTYKLRSDIIDMRSLAESQYLKLKKYKAASFYGQFVNGKRHGKGIMLYNNGRKYQGEWECDLKHGKGYEQFQNGCMYQGFYVNGKPEGLGHYHWPNGEFYEGEWLAGLKHGSGMWSGAKGDSYVGEWKFGKADGHGIHVWINGDRYEGEFKQNLKHGQGTQKFISGDLYKGSFYMGKPHGYGQYYWVDGSFYKGNFRNGFRDGNGNWKKGPENTDKYEGEYIKDKKEGYGIYTWSSGNVYKGNYQNDLREGYGQMYWSDGSYYKGQWRRGNQQGEGILFTKQDGMIKGRFSDNNLVQLYEEIQPIAQELVCVLPKPRRRVVASTFKKLVSKSVQKERNTPTPLKEQKPLILIKQNTEQSRPTSKQYSKPKSHNNISSSKKQKLHSIQLRPAKSKNPTLHELKHQSLQLRQITSGQGSKKQKIPHSALRMRYMDRRFVVGKILKNQRKQMRSNSQLIGKLSNKDVKSISVK